MKRIIVGLLLLGPLSSTHAQDDTSNKFGKGIGIVAADSSFSMKFSTRIQTLFIAEMADDAEGLEDVSTNWLIRRARLKFGGFAYTPKLEYKIELGLTNRDISGVGPEVSNTPRVILDAYTKWNFAGNFELWAGQTKLPGNRERVISSQQLQFVDRSLVNSRFNLDRDIGIQLRHSFKAGNQVFREALAISQGEGRNVTIGNQGGLEYTARLEWLPLGSFTKKGDYSGSDLKRESKPKVSIGLTYDYNDRSARTNGNLGSYVPDSVFNSLSSIQADLMFKYKGFSVMAEYISRTAEDPLVRDTTGTIIGNFYTGSGISLQAGYLFNCNWEVAARYTTVTPTLETGRDIQDMYTLGVSRYIVEHALKVQTDFSYTIETDQLTGTEAGEYMWRLQFELAF
jgi:phosphate-selective porin OprO and OprP